MIIQRTRRFPPSTEQRNIFKLVTPASGVVCLRFFNGQQIPSKPVGQEEGSSARVFKFGSSPTLYDTKDRLVTTLSFGTGRMISAESVESRQRETIFCMSLFVVSGFSPDMYSQNLFGATAGKSHETEWSLRFISFVPDSAVA